jgi:ABC-type spermidine/putrescine transport system permease subunit I
VPFVALPIFVVLENMDRRVLEAAQDLGASRFAAFVRVTFPLSLPGVIAGFVFVLIPTTGEFITPLLVGGPSSQMFGNSIQGFFTETSDWNYGSVLALWLVFVVMVMLLLFGRFLSADLQERAR